MIKRGGIVVAFSTLALAGLSALASPAQANFTGTGGSCGAQGSAGAVVTPPAVAVPGSLGTNYPDTDPKYAENGDKYTCQTSLDKATDNKGNIIQLTHVWNWTKVEATAPSSAPPSSVAPSSVAPSSVAPSSVPASPSKSKGDDGDKPGANKACSPQDKGFVKFNGAVAFTCSLTKDHGKTVLEWVKASAVVGSVCTETDHGVQHVFGSVVTQCTASGPVAGTGTQTTTTTAWKWAKVPSTLGQTCQAPEHGVVHREGELIFKCAKVNKIWQWAATNTIVNTLCPVDAHHAKIIVSGTAVECAPVTVAKTSVWQWTTYTLTTGDTTVTIGSTCSKGATPILVQGKPCTCGQQPGSVQVGASASPAQYVWVADTSSAGPEAISHMPVTGPNVPLIAGAGMAVLFIGSGLFIAARRRHARFVA